MPDLEVQLLELGRASSQAARRPDADAWRDVRERLGEPGITVVPIIGSGRSRSGRLVGVAVVLVTIALVGAALVASGRRGSDGSAGMEANGLPYWLPVPVPDGFRPSRAFDNMPAGLVAGRVMVLRSITGALTVMTLYSWDGTGEPTSGVGDEAVSVHGFAAVLRPLYDDTRSLEWQDDAATYQLLVAGARAADRAFVLDVASRVARIGPTSADVALQPVPDGFAVRFVGSEDRLTPRGGWTLAYEADNGRGFELALTVGGLTAEQLAAVHDYEPVTVNGRSAYVGVGGPGAFPVADPTSHQTLLIDLADGVHLVLASFGITREELLNIAADLRVVDDVSWHAATRGVESYLTTTTTAVLPPR